MPFLSKKEVINLKLNCIPLQDLKILARRLGNLEQSSASEIIKELVGNQQNEELIDKFIKDKYTEKAAERKLLISDDELKNELMKVRTFSWGVVQGQLDQKVQSEYVRKIVRYEDLLENVRAKLHNDITNYVICTWYNHWTTVLIEDHISQHPKVIPTIKNIKGVDIFFDGQPFDLKVTYPKEYISKYGIDKVLNSPQDLAIWMYEHQGAQRFGADNRLFVIVLDKNDPEKSWELKRDFDLVYKRIDNFFDREVISKDDEIVFTYNKRTYTSVAKVLLITK